MQRVFSWRPWVAVCLLVLHLNPRAAFAETFVSGFTETLITEGISSATAMEFAPDGRLFICQQSGELRVVKNLTLLPTPFVTVSTMNFVERGLLGIAFDPGFETNQYLYLDYTAVTPTVHNRVSRFTASGDVALANSEVPILDLEELSAGNHNGGAIHFGPDGYLYVAVGENANPAHAQTLNNRLGKILRINRDGSIPPSNPFYHVATGPNRAIWALGLRNPYTFAVQPGTGRIFINDVGNVTWEEINEGIAGANYGWPNCEGVCVPPQPNFRDPIFQYAHGSNPTNGCAVTGGAFYNPVAFQFPATFRGAYFFADVCGGWIRRWDSNSRTAFDFAQGLASPVDLKVSADGRLFYLARGSGRVWAIDYTNSPPALGIVRQATGSLLLWPATSAYTLQSTTSLTPPIGWETVNGITTANGQSRLQVGSGGSGSRFYRLIRN